MIVVIGVIGMALPVLFGIVFTILQQQTKIYRLSQVKREGDYALTVMKNIIINSVRSLHNSVPPTNENRVCVNNNTTANDLYFQDKNTLGTWSRFILIDNKIASQSSTPPGVNVDLTTNKVRITSFNLSCTGKGPHSPPIINIHFTIQYNTLSTRPEETANLTYQTKVKLRSY